MFPINSYPANLAIIVGWYALKSISTNLSFSGINAARSPFVLFKAAKLIPLNAFDGLPVKVYKLYCVYILPFDIENLGYGISLKYSINVSFANLIHCF